MPAERRRGTGGRPTAAAAVQLETTILDRATAAFLAHGYAATTIEGIARSCGVAKRTIYARWNGKPALFRAVMGRLLARWLSEAGDWAEAEEPEAALRIAAGRILAVALTPEAIALHRLLVAEGMRFPELPDMIRDAGATEGIARVAALLDRAVAQGVLPPQDTRYAAEQFIHLVLAGPQQRALGLMPGFGEQEVHSWGEQAVELFLRGAAR
ncbi:MAG TPA: TetR/AcrR family transcriptional regulator [Rhodopila sp.]|nr:TetR/AcrR family transcriptional regulator [Rhodopila sp.]